ncbi:CHAP domain-containing protein [Paenibacillus tarimensis]
MYGGEILDGEKINQRLESVSITVQEMIMSIDSAVRRQEACVRLYGVSSFASMLAMKRGEKHELPAIAGLLHHYYYYQTGIKEFLGPNSAEAVRPLLRDMNIFAKEEQIIILQAIFHHADRSRTHGPIEETVKDACVLHLYYQNTGRNLTQQDALRLHKVFQELQIPGYVSEESHSSDNEEMRKISDPDRHSKLADIAQVLAGESIIGVPGNERYREICSYWPDRDIYKVLQNSWCAAFVYHCCRLAGFLLPIRYPNGICRFAGVGAWLEWAKLPETGFYYEDGLSGFTPQRGDIVIYEKLLSDKSHDHIGIVLACGDNEIWVAEGNRDNRNFSSILYRDRWSSILGYIRIDNSYKFNFSDSYNPVI